MLVFFYEAWRPTVGRLREEWTRALQLEDYIAGVDIQYLRGEGRWLAHRAAGRYAYMHKGYQPSIFDDTLELAFISDALKGKLRVSKSGKELKKAFRDAKAAHLARKTPSVSI